MTHMSILAIHREAAEEEFRLSHTQNDPSENDEEDVGDSVSDSEIANQPSQIPQLSKIPWFNFNPRDPSLTPGEKEKLITALHALSLTALANFSIELDVAISEYRIASTTISQVSRPPTSHTISHHLLALSSSMPDPFSTYSIEKFGRCHLGYMATEEFFEGREWTGAFAYTGLWGVRAQGSLGRGRGRDVFDCVGGVNRMVRLGGWDKPGEGDTGDERNGVVIEGVVRFSCVEGKKCGEGFKGFKGCEGGAGEKEREGENDVFVLRSNSFYSQVGTHRLELRVRRSTGLIAVRELDAHGRREERVDDGEGVKWRGSCWGAVLTPFGIVGAMSVGASWMWLWKRDWSGGVEEGSD